jgi:hypothetical protein
MAEGARRRTNPLDGHGSDILSTAGSSVLTQRSYARQSATTSRGSRTVWADPLTIAPAWSATTR